MQWWIVEFSFINFVWRKLMACSIGLFIHGPLTLFIMLDTAIRFFTTIYLNSRVRLLRIVVITIRFSFSTTFLSCVMFPNVPGFSSDILHLVSKSFFNTSSSSSNRYSRSRSVCFSSWPPKSSSPNLFPKPLAIFLPSKASLTSGLV